MHDRVSRGGHDVPESTIRRRYAVGLRKFFELYQPLASSWQMFDNRSKRPVLIAAGSSQTEHLVHKPRIWQSIREVIRVNQ